MDSYPRSDDKSTLAVPLGVADVMTMGSLVAALDPADRAEAARCAVDAWGLAGVGVRRGMDWVGAMLIAPSAGVPPSHPLVAGGLDGNTAGIILLRTASLLPALVTGKRLLVALARRLRGQVAAIEVQGSPTPVLASPLVPSAEWLVRLGFEPMRYPVNRYRLDCASLAVRLQHHLQSYLSAPVRLSTRPAPAGRVGRTGD